MKNLLREIHRRSLWQVLGIYLAASWVVLQVVGEIADSLSLPEWVPPFAIVLLLIGLPVVLATAYTQHELAKLRERVEAPREEGDSAERVARTRAGKPQGDVGLDDAEAARAPEAPTADRGKSARHRLFTWRNAIVGGVLAFALLGLLTVSWAVMRTTGVGPAATLVAKGVLDERAPVILADFSSPTGDTMLARAVTEAFRVDIAQSEVVTVLEQRQVSGVLERMERDAGEPLNFELATEVAIREGIPAVIAGELLSAGQQYVVSARVVSPSNGEELISHRETAENADAILDAVDRLSKRLRERIGESLGALRDDPPLHQVTTPSLEALRKYSQAIHALDIAGDEQRSIALLEEAIALDSAFAMAHRKLGTVLNNRLTERARAVESLTRAYEYRDRLTARERYLATAAYHSEVEEDHDAVINAYRNLLEIRPGDPYALNNLGVEYSRLQDEERALQYYLQAIAHDSTNSLSYTNAAGTYFNVGDAESAWEMLELFAQKFPGNASFYPEAAEIAAATGEYERADSLMRTMRSEWTGNLFVRSLASRYLGSIAAIEGRLSEAASHFRDALDADLESDSPTQYLFDALQLAWIDAFARQDRDRAFRTVRSALETQPLEELHPLNRQYGWLAVLYADLGRPDLARATLDEFEAEVGPELWGFVDRILVDWARGGIALEEGRPEEALEINRRASDRGCEICWWVQRARAFEATGRADSAIAYYRSYIETPYSFRLVLLDPWHRGSVLERLAQLYDEKGDVEKAAEYYARFVELWAEADEELQPRVRAAQARLEEIVRERG